MSEGAMLLDLAVECSGIVLCGMAILLLFMGPKIEKRVKGYFHWYFIGCLALNAANIAGLLMRGLPGSEWRVALYLSNYAEFLLPNLIVYLMTRFLLSIVDCEGRLRRLRRTMLALVWLHASLLTLSQFTGLFYVIGPDNLYRRQPLYPLSYLPTGVMQLIDIGLMLRHRKKLTRNEFNLFLVYFIVPSLFSLFQLLQYGINFTIISSIIVGLVMYIFIVNDQTEFYVRQQQENARQHFHNMILQMRPHFIYNAMTSIYYMVDADPQAAKDAIRNFSRYLQRNFSAVVKTEQIPFEEELAHTKAYLAVEHARFRERLEVTYDTPHTIFHLPPLTLEPIVENAVKHGMDPDRDTLHILIRTRAMENGSEITVVNDGAAFKPAESDGDGVGLNSVRERLAMMCGGTLNITPMNGGGATVTLRIPQ